MAITTIRPEDEQDPLTQGNAIKPPARNPGLSIPGLPMPAVRAVPSGGDGTNPLTKIVAALPAMRDQHGNDMTATNKMKAQLGEAPVGTAPAATPAAPVIAPQAAPSPVARDQYGNDMTRTNAMKAQLGEQPIGAPAQNPLLAASSVPPSAAPPGLPAGAQTNQKPRSVLEGGFTGRMYDQNAINRERAAAYKNLPVSPEGPATTEAVPNMASFPQPSAPTATTTAPTIQPGAQDANSAMNPLVSPTSPNAVTTPQAQQPGAVNTAEGQKQTSFTEVGQATAPMQGPVDAHGNSLAATNAMKAQLDEMTSTAPANVTTLENSGLKESQELMDKWGQQDMQREMLQEMGRNPRAANAIAGLAANANNTEAQLRGQDVAAQVNQRNTETTQRGQDLTAETTRRGQDVTATVEGNRLAGNPLDNSLKQVQVQTGQTALDRARANEKAIANINAETDPIKRQAMIEAQLVAQGKNPLTDRYLKVEGGEEIGPDGITKIKRPSGVYDTVTQQFKPMEGAAKPPASAAPTYDVFAAQMKARYPGKVTDDQLKAEYARQFGSK